MINLSLMFIGIFLLFFMVYFGFISISENEKRAAGLAFLFAFIIPIPFLFFGLISKDNILSITWLCLTALTGILLIFPVRVKNDRNDDVPKTKIDERDIMFSRNKLMEGSDRFREYYERNPDKKILDDKFRSKPGLLQKGAKLFEDFSFSAADASFTTVTSLHSLVEKEPATVNPNQADKNDISDFIKKWAKKLGAISVGVTELKDYHLYSTVGRGKDYGKAVELNHKCAIVFTVEMDKRMLDFAPEGPTVMESAQQYLNAGTIAVQIAEFLRNLGYPARAHIDANYRVICPLVARDAGLGEIGRMGLLMTPELGPRVRIGVVTTDLPLRADRRKIDQTLIDFCTRCKKCADACPPKAIPFNNREKIEGVLRWKMNAENCFTYWCVIGTDCGRCIKVCPYSHPNNFLHNLVRKGIQNSTIFRIFALKMDDAFYGRIPKPQAIDLNGTFKYLK